MTRHSKVMKFTFKNYTPTKLKKYMKYESWYYYESQMINNLHMSSSDIYDMCYAYQIYISGKFQRMFHIWSFIMVYHGITPDKLDKVVKLYRKMRDNFDKYKDYNNIKYNFVSGSAHHDMVTFFQISRIMDD